MARLIFCFFAEDTGIFLGEGLFSTRLRQMTHPQSTNTHEVIEELFRAAGAPRLFQGVKSGRRRLMPPTDLVRTKELLATSGLKAADVAAKLKVSERTLFGELRAARDREEVGV